MVKNHKADSFDGGRGASILPDTDPVSIDELKRKDRRGANVDPADDDIRALLLAVIALASANE